MHNSSGFFPLRELQALWGAVEPRRYHYCLTPMALVPCFLMAYVRRLSGLRAISERCGRWLGSSNFSSICHAVRRPSSLAFVRRMVGQLETRHQPGDEELVVIDGMASTLPKSVRHRCAKYNNQTVGGGVVWAYLIEAARGACPVKVLKLIEGAWHDSIVMRQVQLIARGPVYVMDRGFYALDLLKRWLGEQVRFVIRVRERMLVYKRLREVSKPRKIGTLQVTLDIVARLGGPRAKARPVVRLLIAVLPSGERLILATDRLEWPTERVLEAYKKRWHIERFHRFVKECVGMAHLYSFKQSGMHFLLLTALLLALLLFHLTTARCGTETIQILHAALKALRKALGMEIPWRRNTIARTRTSQSVKRKGRNL